MKQLEFKDKNLVSVIMPVYNAGIFLEEAIESVLVQSYKDFEFIIIDDRSTDNSWQIIKKYKTTGKKIRAFRNKKNLGLGTTLNKAIKKAKGVYIARMDADDIMAPNRLEKQIGFLQRNHGVVAVGSFMKEIDEKGEVIGKRRLPTGHKQIYEMMYYLMGLQHPSIMFNRKLIPADFVWYKEKNFVEDLDMLFRLLPYGKFANIPEYLMFYRIHKSNLSLKRAKKIFLRAEKIRERAVRLYGYRPTFKGRVLHFIENIVVSFIPEKYILTLYSLLR